MNIEEAKQKVAERTKCESWYKLAHDLYRTNNTAQMEIHTDEAWQMVLEELQFDYNDLKADYKHSLTCHNKLVVQMEDRITYLKAENERLRKEEKQQGTPLGNLQYDSDYLKESCNRSLWDLAALEDAFKAALFKADANIDFDKAWNNYKEHILK